MKLPESCDRCMKCGLPIKIWTDEDGHRYYDMEYENSIHPDCPLKKWKEKMDLLKWIVLTILKIMVPISVFIGAVMLDNCGISKSPLLFYFLGFFTGVITIAAILTTVPKAGKK